MLKEEYRSLEPYKCSYVGLSFKDDKFKEYLVQRVKDRYFDVDGTHEISEYAIESTGFDDEKIIESIKKTLESQIPIENWRIGEVVAELILEENFNVSFYYDSTRDARNMKASLPGADLVGFTEIDGDTVFAFGEVKTSYQERFPPNVLSGRTGMIKQLEDLKSLENKRDELVRWITFKSKDIRGELHVKYKEALTTYIYKNKERIKLIGVLVRDTIPNENDLKNRAKTLGEDKSDLMDIELIAIYSNYKMQNNQWIHCLQGVECNES